MGIEKKVYSFRLEEKLIEKMGFYAREQNRSLSNFVETILKNEIEKLDKKQEIYSR